MDYELGGNNKIFHSETDNGHTRLAQPKNNG